MTEKKHLLSDILKQSSKFFQPKLWKAQKVLHDTLLWVDSKNYPKLIPAEPFGSELQRFQDPSKAMVSWADKQLQTWQISGTLQSKAHREFGVSARFLQRRTQDDRFFALPAHWVSPQLHFAEFFLNDPKNALKRKSHRVFRKSSLLGHKGVFSRELLHVEVGGWFLQSTDVENYKLCISTGVTSLFLDLKPMKPLVYLGQAGYLQRFGSSEEGAFHCVLPRLKAAGHLSVDGKIHFVEGIFRLEHEKKTLLQNDTQANAQNDWLSMSFQNGCELVYFQTPTEKPVVSWIDAKGIVSHFEKSQVHEEVLQYWASPRTGLRYPLKRKITIVPLDLGIEIEPTSLDQETHSRVLGSSWSGQVKSVGALSGQGFAVYRRSKLDHHFAKNLSRLNPLVPLRKLF